MSRIPMGSNCEPEPGMVCSLMGNHIRNPQTPQCQGLSRDSHNAEESDDEVFDDVITTIEARPQSNSTMNQEYESRSHYSTTTGTTTGQTLQNTSKTSKTSGEGSGPSTSTRDSLLSPSSRARQHQTPPAFPRRADFGEYYPDGGWGWVVCGSVFVIHFLAHGWHLAGGTLLVEIMAEFELTESYSVWLFSVSYMLAFILSPLVVAVCRRKSPRLLAMVGGLIAALGNLFMSFSTHRHQLFVSGACVVPLGTGLIISTAGVVLGRYFRKRRECAEMLALCGSGVGMAVVSVCEAQVFSSLTWMRGMQAVTGLIIPTVIAGAFYRSPSIYHPRRRVILHIKNLTKTKKQRRDFENRPPYFDFSPLRMRAMQVLLVSTATTSFGTYVPFLLLTNEAALNGIQKPSANLLMVFLGVAFAFGSLIFGLVVLRHNLHCMVARQYLCQITSFGCGVATLLFIMADEFEGYALYVWAYGLLYGGYVYTIRVYTYEQVTVKLSERSLGYVAFAQGLPVVLGVPVAQWLGTMGGGQPQSRYGFIFAGGCMVLGSLILFLMPVASKHKSNSEVIQEAHLNCKNYEDDFMFWGMDVSDEVSTSNRTSRNAKNNVYNFNAVYNRRNKDNQNPWTYAGCKLGVISDTERWSDIEAMTPMSPTDKVTEFLVHSQTMLQSFSQFHQIDLPNVKLEINNQYHSDPELSLSEDEIKDLTLQATVCRNSPHHRSTKSRTDNLPPTVPPLYTRSDPETHTQQENHISLVHTDYQNTPDGVNKNYISMDDRQIHIPEEHLRTGEITTTV